VAQDEKKDTPPSSAETEPPRDPREPLKRTPEELAALRKLQEPVALARKTLDQIAGAQLPREPEEKPPQPPAEPPAKPARRRNRRAVTVERADSAISELRAEGFKERNQGHLLEKVEERIGPCGLRTLQKAQARRRAREVE
jgi:chromatin segregation and condensation protein Rec8/ScpA/Scc1 (kleisin family)